jgi:membrane protease YdiL (CAAX protease family)
MIVSRIVDIDPPSWETRVIVRLLRELALDMGAWFVLAVLGGVVVALLCRKLPSRPILPLQKPGPVPWGGAEVFLSFFSFLLWSLVFQWLVGKVAGLLVAVLAFPFVLGTIGVLLSVAHVVHDYPIRRTLHRFFVRCFRANVRAGYRVWLIVSPVVLLVNTATVLVYVVLSGEAPREHPLVRALHQEPGRLQWVLVLFNAVVVAPILEEVLFRGVLLPWMSRGGRAIDVVAVVAVLVSATDVQGQGLAAPIFVTALLPVYFAADRWTLRWLPRPAAGRAVVGSAILFAAFHSTNWPAPVPLFLLGLALGYLAYRTQSLVGPIFVHALFNGVACVLLLLHQEVAPAPENGKELTPAERGPAAICTSRTVPGSWLLRRMYPNATTCPNRGEKAEEVR